MTLAVEALSRFILNVIICNIYSDRFYCKVLSPSDEDKNGSADPVTCKLESDLIVAIF